MKDSPYVSIIMPIRNEADFIARSLGAVLAQDYTHELLEVIIADGMSTDNTRAQIERVCSASPNVRVTIVDNPRGIVPTGMNLAFARARGEIIIRVDGHCEIPPAYVSKCVKYLRDDLVDGVGGSVKTVGATQTAKVIALSMASRFGVGDSMFRVSSGETRLVDAVPFPAYKRKLMELAGHYDEEQVRNQDDEYNYRALQLGARILLAGDICSWYYSRASYVSLWRQYFQYGYWKVRVLQKHPKQMRLRQFVPPAFAASLLGTLAITPLVGLLPFAFITGLYLTANLTASLITGVKKDLRALPLLPIAFATLHLSYGLGFLAGLVKFWNRWGDRQNRLPTWDANEANQQTRRAVHVG